MEAASRCVGEDACRLKCNSLFLCEQIKIILPFPMMSSSRMLLVILLALSTLFHTNCKLIRGLSKECVSWLYIYYGDHGSNCFSFFNMGSS